MSKDLFEQQIGDALRKAESTPPVGAWETIKSQIASPYTPSFKFPTWAVIAVSTVLLGGMALSDQGSELPEPDMMASNVSVERYEKIQPSEKDANNVIKEAVKGEPAANVQEISSNATGDTEEQMKLTTPAESESTVVEKPDSEMITDNASNEQSESKENSDLPVQVDSSYPTDALVEQANEETREPETFEDNNTAIAHEANPILTVEGIKTCYTPCELTLNASGNATEYSWDAASFGLIEGKSLKLTINEPQLLTVYAIARYENGTERTLPRRIEVKPGSELFVPNSFTPNGDGVNDSYSIGATGIEAFSMTIINSKGKVVFQTSNINEAWNFNRSANELENEFYTAIVRATGIDGKVHTVNQRLTILP